MHTPTPDLAYEYHMMPTLVQIPEMMGGLTLPDILKSDIQNAYRKIFGACGDGITETMLYHIALLPRKETF